nr:FAD-binding protein [uncultured Haemophilus sp.]
MPHIKITQTLKTDLLIVGGGIAGLSCSVEAHKKGINHILITKTKLGSGASFFPLKATLGIQVTGDENDKALFKEDIERVAQGMNNPEIVKAYIEDSPRAVSLLNEIGFQAWKRNDNRPACFARYPRPIYLINQWQDAAKKAKEIIANQTTTSLFEDASLVHIAVENNRVIGAVFAHKVEQKIEYIFVQTPAIILASGGIAGLYKDNLYPADVLGSSHYLALQAGAKLTNLEYIQFIPAFIEPKYKVLFGEHTLKYCTAVTDKQGHSLFPELSAEAFQQMVAERSSYAPFSVDFPCVKFDLRIMQYLIEHPEEQGVYLHYSPELYQDQTEFYRVYLDWLKADAGIDLLKDKVAIAPFAHSCNGGIEIDTDAQSYVKGLFAVGEVSSCIEGANRLGGNSVGGSLVFSKRAIAKIQQNLTACVPSKMDEQAVENAIKNVERVLNSLQNINADSDLTASQVLSETRLAMSKYANVYRTEENLYKLREKLNRLERDFNPIAYADFQGIEIYYALKTAQLIVNAMLARKESRGAHYRADYPKI